MKTKYAVMAGFIDEFNTLRYARKGGAVSLATAIRKAKAERHTSYITQYGKNVPVEIFEK